jgi:hypothetical protein
MRFDETELTEFFGVLPVEQDPEEKEFFGSSEFEVVRGKFTLSISVSPTHSPKVIIDLLSLDAPDPVLHVEIREAVAVRVDQKERRLVVLARPENARGGDPDLAERLRISLDPLKVTVCD